jgi:L-fucose mutarotase
VLRGIDPLLNGELLKMLDELGHGDQLVIADRNFPAYTQGRPVVRLAVDDNTRVFEAVLSVFPLDTFIESPLERMGPQDDPSLENEKQRAALAVARKHLPGVSLVPIPRFDFYERAKAAHAVIATLETAPYCCFILTKGVITD